MGSCSVVVLCRGVLLHLVSAVALEFIFVHFVGFA